jgi:GNAT superfamily N-acetyltransferase
LCGQAALRIGATTSTSGSAPGYIARMKLRLLTPVEKPLAARIIANGMVGDPVQRSIHGPDVSTRLRGMELAFGATLRETERPTLGAWEDGELLGAATYGPPGSCPLPEERREALSQAVADLPLPAHENFHAWRANWGAHDPAEPHWHLGPFAVRADAQARGIGSRLLIAFLELVDKHEGTAYLETDTTRNVRFYERFGFEPAGRDEVLGVECTFMSRRPTSSRP